MTTKGAAASTRPRLLHGLARRFGSGAAVVVTIVALAIMWKIAAARHPLLHPMELE